MMMLARTLLSSVVIAAVGMGSAVSAPKEALKPAASKSTAPVAVTPAVIAKWIRTLDSDRFQDRQQATKQLAQAGRQAFGALVAAAQGESAEVTTRAVRILTKAFRSGQADVKAAAKKSLEQLSKSSHPVASRQAKRVLDVATAKRQPAGRRIVFGGAGARIQIRAVVVGGGMQIQVQNINGKKTTDVTDKDKKIHIEESPTGQITMQVTEKVNGKQKTSKYKAANAAELKKTSPKAYQLYKKYSGVGQGQIFVVPVGGAGRPIRVRAIPVGRNPRPAADGKALKQIQQAQQELRAATKQLRKLAESKTAISPDAVRKLADRIAAAEKKLQTARKALAAP